METEQLVQAAEVAARNARRAAVLALVAVSVAVVVLVIDNGIKRAIISEAQQMRGTLDQFRAVAREAVSGQAVQTGATVGPDRGAADGVADATGSATSSTRGIAWKNVSLRTYARKPRGLMTVKGPSARASSAAG